MFHERDTIRRIRQAVADRRLTEPFRAADVNRVLRIDLGTAPLREGKTVGFSSS
jgi:hypothetical protein